MVTPFITSLNFFGFNKLSKKFTLESLKIDLDNSVVLGTKNVKNKI